MKNLFKFTVLSLSILTTSILTTPSVLAESTLQSVTKSGELKVCFDVGYMPFEMKNKSGQIIGFDIDIAKHLARSMNVKYVEVNTAWDGIIPALLTNKCDVIMGGMTITTQRNMQVNFTDPYIVIGQSIIVNNKHKGKINSYQDLNNEQYTIAARLGTTGIIAAERFLPKAKMNKFETSADAALETSNGKADALVYDLPFNAVYAGQNTDSVYHIDEPFTFEPLGLAIRQGDPDFLNLLNNYLAQIKGDGTYDRIYDKWFKSVSWLNQVQ